MQAAMGGMKAGAAVVLACAGLAMAQAAAMGQAAAIGHAISKPKK
jgi:hypothetical protein